MLEFLFARDGVVDVLIAFKINQSSDLVAGCEGAWCLSPVLHDANAEIVCDSNVENVRAVGEDVDEEFVLVVSWHGALRLLLCGYRRNADSLRE